VVCDVWDGDDGGDGECAKQRLNALHNSLQGDMDTVAEIRNNITKELKNAEIAVRYTERLAANVPLISQQNFVLPPQYGPPYRLTALR
jgi:hypothetical protein